MAISNLLPRKTMPSRTRLQSMAERHDYDQKPEKTRDGELVSSYMCSPETAAEEFEISKQLYYQLTGRSQPKKRDVIMYRIIQSFRPGEVSPEEANRIGYELAMRFTEGRHQFVVATHVDKAHIHTHIEFNSTNLDCDGKFKNVKDSALVLRRLNDEICKAHGLSIIEHSKRKAKLPGEAAAVKYGVSFKEQLRQAIDKALPESVGFEDFLERMRAQGYEVKQGKYLSFRAPGQERFTRSHRLGDGYTLEALRTRTGNRRGYASAAQKPLRRDGRKINLLIDIQAKLAAGKGVGYEKWATIFNLKEAARTLNFLMENHLTDYDGLAARAEQAGAELRRLLPPHQAAGGPHGRGGPAQDPYHPLCQDAGGLRRLQEVPAQEGVPRRTRRGDRPARGGQESLRRPGRQAHPQGGPALQGVYRPAGGKAGRV